jgi:hypothetical protein
VSPPAAGNLTVACNAIEVGGGGLRVRHTAGGLLGGPNHALVIKHWPLAIRCNRGSSNSPGAPESAGTMSDR